MARKSCSNTRAILSCIRDLWSGSCAFSKRKTSAENCEEFCVSIPLSIPRTAGTGVLLAASVGTLLADTVEEVANCGPKRVTMDGLEDDQHAYSYRPLRS